MHVCVSAQAGTSCKLVPVVLFFSNAVRPTRQPGIVMAAKSPGITFKHVLCCQSVRVSVAKQLSILLHLVSCLLQARAEGSRAFRGLACGRGFPGRCH